MTCKNCGDNHRTEDCTYDDPGAKHAARVAVSDLSAEAVETVNKNVQRVYRWREKHREEYNKYQRRLMRKRRANGR